VAVPTETIWQIEPHTTAKHQILGRYLHAWFPILGRFNRKLVYVDGFAGPGCYLDGEPGSTELLNVLNVLSLLVELEPAQADLLDRICAGPLFSNDALAAANALVTPPKREKLKKAKSTEPQLF